MSLESQAPAAAVPGRVQSSLSWKSASQQKNADLVGFVLGVLFVLFCFVFLPFLSF